VCRLSFLDEGYKVGQSGWNRGVRSLSTSSSARLVSDVGDKTRDSTDSLFPRRRKSKTSYTTKIRRREPTTTPCFTANDIITTNILVRPLPTDKRKRMTRVRLDLNGILNRRPLGPISSHWSRRLNPRKSGRSSRLIWEWSFRPSAEGALVPFVLQRSKWLPAWWKASACRITVPARCVNRWGFLYLDGAFRPPRLKTTTRTLR